MKIDVLSNGIRSKEAGMNYHKSIVTGAPCSGKSSLIAHLQKNGYQTIPEVFHLLYAQAFENNTAQSFFDNPIALRYQLMNTQIDLESRLNPRGTAFLDRSVWDIIFFGEWYNIPMPQDLYDLAAHQHYDCIFFLDLLPQRFYQTTQFRGESFEVAQKMHQFFLERYSKIGLSFIKVPFNTVEKRASFIIDHLSNLHEE